MVVKNRIAYLRRLLHHKAKINVSITTNPTTGVEKVKVVVDPSTPMGVAQQLLAAATLDMLDNACLERPVADKGHKHSNGVSEVQFFLSPMTKNVVTSYSGVHLNPSASPFVPADSYGGKGENLEHSSVSGQDTSVGRMKGLPLSAPLVVDPCENVWDDPEQVVDSGCTNALNRTIGTGKEIHMSYIGTWESLPASAWSRIYHKFGPWHLVEATLQTFSDLIEDDDYVMVHNRLFQIARSKISRNGSRLIEPLLASLIAKLMKNLLNDLGNDVSSIDCNQRVQFLYFALPERIDVLYMEAIAVLTSS